MAEQIEPTDRDRELARLAEAREEGRRAAIEECARVAAELAGDVTGDACCDWIWHDAATAVANKIRALLPEPPQAEGER